MITEAEKTNANKDKLIETTIKNLFVTKLSDHQTEKMKAYHNELSRRYGVKVGCAEETQFWTISNLMKTDETVQVNNRQTILSFLRAKDDNMILLMTGLINQVQSNSLIWTAKLEESQGVFSYFVFGDKDKPKEVDSTPYIGDLFALTNIETQIAEASIQSFHQTKTSLSVIYHLFQIFDIQP